MDQLLRWLDSRKATAFCWLVGWSGFGSPAKLSKGSLKRRGSTLTRRKWKYKKTFSPGSEGWKKVRRFQRLTCPDKRPLLWFNSLHRSLPRMLLVNPQAVRSLRKLLSRHVINIFYNILVVLQYMKRQKTTFEPWKHLKVSNGCTSQVWKHW